VTSIRSANASKLERQEKEKPKVTINVIFYAPTVELLFALCFLSARQTIFIC